MLTRTFVQKYNPLKLCDILKHQELNFYFKYKNNKLPHYLQSLPFYPNTETHDIATRISPKIHQPYVNMLLQKVVFVLIFH